MSSETQIKSKGRSDEGDKLRANYHDPKDQLYALYLTEADKEDKKLVDNLKGDADGILIFTGLFAATVASFNIEFYKTLQPDAGQASAALMVILSQQIISPLNGTQPQPAAALSALQSASGFKPSRTSILINSFWFLSLFLSLLCALFATLIQQWSRQYSHSTQRRGPPHIRGRLQVYLSRGMQEFRITHVVEWMIALLHLALILFLAGLIVFLFSTNSTVAYAVLSLAILSATAYAALSILPIFYGDCPYKTPFTAVFKALIVGPAIVLFRTILSFRRAFVQRHLSTIDRFLVDATWTEYLSRAHRLWQTRWDMSEHSYRSDEHMLRRTFGLLDEEHEIQFFFDNVHALSRAYEIPVARYFHKSLLSWDDFIAALSRLLQSYQDACSRTGSKALAMEGSADCLRFLWRLLTCADQRHSTQSLTAFLPPCDYFADVEEHTIALHAKCSRAFIYSFCLEHLKSGPPVADERTASAMKQIALLLQDVRPIPQSIGESNHASAGEKFELDHDWLRDNGQIANIIHLSRALTPILTHMPAAQVDVAINTIRLLVVSASAPTLSSDMRKALARLYVEVQAKAEDPSSPPGLVRLAEQLALLATSIGLESSFFDRIKNDEPED